MAMKLDTNASGGGGSKKPTTGTTTKPTPKPTPTPVENPSAVVNKAMNDNSSALNDYYEQQARIARANELARLEEEERKRQEEAQNYKPTEEDLARIYNKGAGNTVVETPTGSSGTNTGYDASEIVRAMMDFLNAKDSRYADLIERMRRNGKKDNLSNMNWKLNQWKKTYGSGNGIYGQGLTNKMDIYHQRSKDDRLVDEYADNMLLNNKSNTYDNASNLVQSALSTGALTPEQLRKLYSNLM